MMPRTGGELAILHGAQFAAERRLGDADPERVPKLLAQIDQPPADHAVDRRHRTALNGPHQRCSVRVIKAGWLPRRLAVDQPVRTMRIELQHPVPRDLPGDAANRRGVFPARAVVDRSQGQQAPGLRATFRALGQRSQAKRVKIRPEQDGRSELSWFANLESDVSRFGNPPPESGPQRLGIIEEKEALAFLPKLLSYR